MPFKRKFIDPQYVHEKFQASELLARGHFSTIRPRNGTHLEIDVNSFTSEIEGIQKTSGDDKRLGNRCASASL